MADGEGNADHLVMLVHGIRDNGFWKQELAGILGDNGFKVARANFGRMNAIEFLLPISYFRNRATTRVWGQIQDAVNEHVKKYPEGKVSFIAHSFGTWVVARLLLENKLLHAYRVIFCGSVVRDDYPVDRVRTRFAPPILNEVGTADIWPAMAESVTWGYGSVGTYGFNVGLDEEVRDRFHNGLTHSDFLNGKFLKDKWIPFLEGAEPVDTNRTPDPPAKWVQAIRIVQIKWLIAALVVVALFFAWLAIFYGPHSYSYRADSAEQSQATATTSFYPWNGAISQLHRDLNQPCWLPLGLCGVDWLRNFITHRHFISVGLYQDTLEQVFSCKPWAYPPAGRTEDPLLALQDLQLQFPDGAVIKIADAQDGIEMRVAQTAPRVPRTGQKDAVLVGCSAEQVAQFPNAGP